MPDVTSRFDSIYMHQDHTDHSRHKRGSRTRHKTWRSTYSGLRVELVEYDANLWAKLCMPFYTAAKLLVGTRVI